MEKLFIDRKAADNKYLHRDFHVTADNGITYVGENYGDDAVIEFLTQYAKSFYSLLVKEFEIKGLKAIEQNFVSVYEKEEWTEYLHTYFTENELKITVDKCPAVTYMKSIGHTPSKWYKQTTYTTYKVLADMCNLDFVVNYYSEEDGSTEFVFTRRK